METISTRILKEKSHQNPIECYLHGLNAVFLVLLFGKDTTHPRRWALHTTYFNTYHIRDGENYFRFFWSSFVWVFKQRVVYVHPSMKWPCGEQKHCIINKIRSFRAQICDATFHKSIPKATSIYSPNAFSPNERNEDDSNVVWAFETEVSAWK